MVSKSPLKPMSRRVTRISASTAEVSGTAGVAGATGAGSGTGAGAATTGARTSGAGEETGACATGMEPKMGAHDAKGSARSSRAAEAREAGSIWSSGMPLGASLRSTTGTMGAGAESACWAAGVAMTSFVEATSEVVGTTISTHKRWPKLAPSGPQSLQ